MLRKVFFVLFLALVITVGVFSQNVFYSNLNYHNNQTENQFRTELSDFRFYNLNRGGTLEMDDNPSYVWQDISRQLRNYYGNRPPRVGDVFLYSGAYDNGFNWYILFRITEVDGMDVTKWQPSRWRGR